MTRPFTASPTIIHLPGRETKLIGADSGASGPVLLDAQQTEHAPCRIIFAHQQFSKIEVELRDL